MAKHVFKIGLNNEERAELKAVIKVAKQCNYEAKHTRRVTQIALEIWPTCTN
jgi:hypothetical protein